jgi:hypothetical protein
MSQSLRAHPRAAALLAVTVSLGVAGLGACSSSDAQVETTVAVAATQPTVTTAAPAPAEESAPDTVRSETTISTGAGNEAVVLSDDEVADLERQLDEIDQLLAGVDADLSQD